MNTEALKAAYEIALARGKAVAQSLLNKRKSFERAAPALIKTPK
jgi:hypothetical protein